MTDQNTYAPSFRLDGKVAPGYRGEPGHWLRPGPRPGRSGGEGRRQRARRKALADLASTIPGSFVVPMDMRSVASINEGVARVEKHFADSISWSTTRGLGANHPRPST